MKRDIVKLRFKWSEGICNGLHIFNEQFTFETIERAYEGDYIYIMKNEFENNYLSFVTSHKRYNGYKSFSRRMKMETN